MAKPHGLRGCAGKGRFDRQRTFRIRLTPPEEQRDERHRADPGQECLLVPFIALGLGKPLAGQESGEEWDAQIYQHRLCNRPEADMDNWLDGDFVAAAPNQKWAGDITYVWTSEGWLYLAVILDLHSRRVVGWAVSDRMKKDLAIRALDMAVRLRNPPPGCLFHSDRGSQYCSYAYQKKLQAHGLRPSMSGTGIPIDSTDVENALRN